MKNIANQMEISCNPYLSKKFQAATPLHLTIGREFLDILIGDGHGSTDTQMQMLCSFGGKSGKISTMSNPY